MLWLSAKTLSGSYLSFNATSLEAGTRNRTPGPTTSTQNDALPKGLRSAAITDRTRKKSPLEAPGDSERMREALRTVWRAPTQGHAR
jgi:hypothetical protein